MSGINAVIFYSTDIFTGDKVGYESENAAKIGTMLVGVVNWLFAMLIIPLLVKFGRKLLLIVGQVGMGICLGILGVLAIIDSQLGIKIFTLGFVAFFELGIGPVFWVVASEIMTESGMAVASLITWAFTILFGLFTPKLFILLKPAGVYFTFAGIVISGLLFILFFVKETKGKSKLELNNLYASDGYEKLQKDEKANLVKTTDA